MKLRPHERPLLVAFLLAEAYELYPLNVPDRDTKLAEYAERRVQEAESLLAQELIGANWVCFERLGNAGETTSELRLTAEPFDWKAGDVVVVFPPNKSYNVSCQRRTKSVGKHLYDISNSTEGPQP